MKTTNQMKTQRGFFDLGISLIILALGGTTAAVVKPGHSETSIAQQPVAITAEAAPRQNLNGYDIDS